LHESALGDSFRSVESKQPRRCRTDTGNPFNHSTFDLKMLGPAVRPRVKEPDNLTCTGVYRGNVTSLVPVADQAGVGQVFGSGGTAVLATDDVVDLGGKPASSSWRRQCSQRWPARRATSARSSSLTSLATREDLAGSRLTILRICSNSMKWSSSASSSGDRASALRRSIRTASRCRASGEGRKSITVSGPGWCRGR